MANFSIDIVIPTYNEYKNLKKLLPFLKKYGADRLASITVVDAQGSLDSTEALCSDLGVNYLRSQINQRAHQLNIGAHLGTAPVLYFIHADTIPPASFASDIEASLATGSDYGCFSYQFDSKNFWLKINSFFTRFNGFFTGGGDQTLFIRRAVFEQSKGYPSVPIMEDFEYWDHLKASGYKNIVLRPMAVVSDRKYQQNSYLKINFIQLIILLSYKLGFSHETQLKMYRKFIKQG